MIFDDFYVITSVELVQAKPKREEKKRLHCADLLFMFMNGPLTK